MRTQQRFARSTREAFGHPGPAIERPRRHAGDRAVIVAAVLAVVVVSLMASWGWL